MSKDPFTKTMGCLGSVLALAASITLGYLSMRFGWGLEVKSWTAYIWYRIVGSLATFVIATLFSKLTTD